MVIGGKSGANYINTVELFNWNTREVCSFPHPLPDKFAYTSGTSLNGVPVVCGGHGEDGVPRQTCFKFDDVEKDWVKVGAKK